MAFRLKELAEATAYAAVVVVRVQVRVFIGSTIAVVVDPVAALDAVVGDEALVLAAVRFPLEHTIGVVVEIDKAVKAPESNALSPFAGGLGARQCARNTAGTTVR